MEIHKPKAVHGWGEFLKEVGIIVLGVLIALSAEQVVEALHWGHKMTELRAAMTAELTTDDGPEAWFRLAAHDCLDRYLDALQAAAEGGADRMKLASLAGAHPGYGPALFTWDMEGWRSLLAADGAAHMPSDELAKWTATYIIIPEMQHYAQDEREAIGALQSIRPTTGPMTPAELDDLARSLQRLRADNDWIANYATFYLSSLQKAGLKADPRAIAALYRSHGYGLYKKSIDAARLTGCEVTPDLNRLDLRGMPSMAPGASGAPAPTR